MNHFFSLKRVYYLYLFAIYLALFNFLGISGGACQDNALVLNGGYIKLSGGTSSAQIYIVVNHGHPAAIARTGGNVISEGEYNRVKWNIGTATGAHTFPFGKADGAYIPVTINNSSDAGNVSISTWPTDNLNNPRPAGVTNMYSDIALQDENAGGCCVIDRFWDISSSLSLPLANTVTLSFTQVGAENTMAVTGDELVFQHWNGSAWNAGTTAGTASGTYVASGINGITSGTQTVTGAGFTYFSPYVLSRRTSPLPIELLEFTARWKDKAQTAALLQWKTAAEINNDYFEIQRSSDAINFKTIGIKQGVGNATIIIAYEFIDQNPFSPLLEQGDESGVKYYRLKQVDYDGSYTYSNIEAISKTAGINLIIIYPNPSSKYIDYLIYSSEDVSVSVFAIDAASKTVISEKYEIKKGLNKQRVNTQRISSGTYVLLIAADENNRTEKQFIIK